MATVALWNRCNNRCIMCTNPLYFQNKELSRLFSYQELTPWFLSRKGDDFHESFHLTGGEPTIHPDFLKILAFIRREFPRKSIYLISNGRMFFYEEFTEKVLAFRDIILQIAVLGHTAELHDSITSIKGSFEQTVSGIKNIISHKREGQKLEIRVVLTRRNIAHLDDIIDFIYREFAVVDTLVIIFPEPEGRCEANFEKAGLLYSEAGDIICDAAMRWKDRFSDFRIYHFPLCTVDRRLWPYLWVTQDPEEVTYQEKCSSCAVKEYCCGIHKNYIKIAGDKEFRKQEKDILLELNRGEDKKHHPVLKVL